jgi:hypothetical protein
MGVTSTLFFCYASFSSQEHYKKEEVQ